MYATISADIVSSTTLSKEETINLKQRIESLLQRLEKKYPGLWGRMIKGDYIECVTSEVSSIFRIALIIKSHIKSFVVNKNENTKKFQTYGVRMAIGIGEMRIVDKEQNIMDGEAIYLSGRAIEKMEKTNKGTLTIEINNQDLSAPLRIIALLTDALINDTTPKQSEVLYYKLLGKKEKEIAENMNIKQSVVNEHASLAKWYCIQEALFYFKNQKY